MGSAKAKRRLSPSGSVVNVCHIRRDRAHLLSIKRVQPIRIVGVSAILTRRSCFQRVLRWVALWIEA